MVYLKMFSQSERGLKKLKQLNKWLIVLRTSDFTTACSPVQSDSLEEGLFPKPTVHTHYTFSARLKFTTDMPRWENKV